MAVYIAVYFYCTALSRLQISTISAAIKATCFKHFLQYCTTQPQQPNAPSENAFILK